MSMDYIRRTYGVPAKRGGRVQFTNAPKACKGTVVAARGQYLRVRWDESGRTDTMHPTWMLVYLKTPNAEASGRRRRSDGLPCCMQPWRTTPTTPANRCATHAKNVGL